MGIIGFAFTKVSAEKKQNAKGKISVTHNINIDDFQEHSLNLGTEDDKAFKVNFEFSVLYEPNIGNITLQSEIIALDDKKKVEAALKKWKKDKKLEGDLMAPIFEFGLKKARLKALFIAEDINLPPPFKLPDISVKPSDAPASKK